MPEHGEIPINRWSAATLREKPKAIRPAKSGSYMIQAVSASGHSTTFASLVHTQKEISNFCPPMNADIRQHISRRPEALGAVGRLIFV
jgi:hypothetical protein